MESFIGPKKIRSSWKCKNAIFKYMIQLNFTLGAVEQSVGSPTADPCVASSILSRSYTVVEIDHEIIIAVILLLLLTQEGLISVTSESICTKYWLTT